MDAAGLDGLLGELRPLLLGALLGRVRPVGSQAVSFELRLLGRDRRLWFEVAPGTAGLYLLTREEARLLEARVAGEPGGKGRQALLLLRKHAAGRRISTLERVPGERVLSVGLGSAELLLRLSSPGPALTLVLDGQALATLGSAPVWPRPQPQAERGWLGLTDAALDEALVGWGREGTRRLLAACPELGPLLARALTDNRIALPELKARLSDPRPTLLAPDALDQLADVELSASPAVQVAPLALEQPGQRSQELTSWVAATASFLVARHRVRAFEARLRATLEAERRELRRLGQLQVNLQSDLAGLVDAAVLRRQAEALLAHAGPLVPDPDTGEVEVRDPYAPERRLRLRLEVPGAAPPSADRLFEKARRVERARVQIAERLAQVRREIGEREADEEKARGARNLADLPAPPTPAPSSPARPARKSRTADAPSTRRFLTSRGLMMLVGKGAKENQSLTFGIAAPEDYWLHARDVPGAHVILRDPEGRAGPTDLREAAEVAAFCSDARAEARVDVHVARRKHLRPGKGAGRVIVGHSETLRVEPRDPEDRLRRR